MKKLESLLWIGVGVAAAMSPWLTGYLTDWVATVRVPIHG